MKRRTLVALVLGLIVLGTAACGSASPIAGAKTNTTKSPGVYVALGGSESTELNFHRLAETNWTQLLYRSVYGTAGIFYDLASPGATIDEVLNEQLPIALRLHPNLVTIWASGFDLIEGTSPGAYGTSLGVIIKKLRAEHARVLVANATPVEQFPFYASCLADPRGCSTSHISLPTLATLAQSESRYDLQIVTVAHDDGASVVNVASVLTHAIANTGGSDPLVANGTALSASGAALIAHAFAADTRWPSQSHRAERTS